MLILFLISVFLIVVVGIKVKEIIFKQRQDFGRINKNW